MRHAAARSLGQSLGPILALLAALAPPGSALAQTQDRGAAAVEVLREGGFTGDVALALADGNMQIFVGDNLGEAHGIDRTQSPWPYASVTKQIVAVMVMQAVENGELALDAPITEYLHLPDSPGIAAPTIRQLLQHRSGLADPDETPMDDRGWPQFYRYDGPLDRAGWCLEARSAPPQEGWVYNNCDYIVLGAILAELEMGTQPDKFEQRFLRMIAQPSGMIAPRLINADLAPFVFDADETSVEVLPAYGAAGALGGNIGNLVVFGRALLDGELISQQSLDEMWQPDPQLGYMALGQWVITVPLEGCADPVRIVERHGAIGKYQARHYIMPDAGIVFAAATNQSEAELEFGQIWMGQGLAYNALSALACGETQ